MNAGESAGDPYFGFYLGRARALPFIRTMEGRDAASRA
jgi:hypothetical protein